MRPQKHREPMRGWASSVQIHYREERRNRRSHDELGNSSVCVSWAQVSITHTGSIHVCL